MMTARRLVIAIAFLGIVFMASRPMIDTDTWWHLRTGQWILDHHALPEVDRFSFTRSGTAWYYPAWLSEILMVKVFSIAGLPGLNLLFACLIVLSCIVIFLTMRGDPYLRMVVLVFAAGASEIYWSARPQIFTFLFSACFFYCLREFLQGRKNILWILPILMVLWVNTHAGFFMGFVFLLLAVVKEGLHFLSSHDEYSPDRLRKFLWVSGTGVACFLTCGINPSGWKIIAYPFQTVSVQFLQNFIQEWQTPNFHYWNAQLFLILFFITWAVIAFSPKPFDAGDFFLLAIIGYMGFLAGRNTYFLSIIAPALILDYGQPILESRLPGWAPSKVTSKILGVVNVAILAAATIGVAVLVVQNNTLATIETVIRREIPVDAVEFLSKNPGWGRMFNSYNWGSYLLWNLPSYPVFVDGRTDLYDDEILNQYIHVVDARAGWQDILQTWNIHVMFLDPSAPILQVLIAEGWQVRYQDDQSVILLRPLQNAVPIK
jgi:hypothetical protein